MNIKAYTQALILQALIIYIIVKFEIHYSRMHEQLCHVEHLQLEIQDIITCMYMH